MIKKLSDDTFFMYQGDTGTIGFVISGDYNVDDEYVFSIKKGLNYKPFISQTFKGKPNSIYTSAFSGCTNLTTIRVPWAEGEVSGAPFGATNATLIYSYVE